MTWARELRILWHTCHLSLRTQRFEVLPTTVTSTSFPATHNTCFRSERHCSLDVKHVVAWDRARPHFLPCFRTSRGHFTPRPCLGQSCCNTAPLLFISPHHLDTFLLWSTWSMTILVFAHALPKMYGSTNKKIHAAFIPIRFGQNEWSLDRKGQFLINYCQQNLVADGRSAGAGLRRCSFSSSTSTRVSRIVFGIDR